MRNSFTIAVDLQPHRNGSHIHQDSALHVALSPGTISPVTGSAGPETEEADMPKKGKRKAPERSYARLARHERNSRQHWRRIRTNNAIERLNREIRRRTRVVGTFPDGNSALMLVTARLKYVAESEWGSRRYLDVTLLEG